jgi:hypothetical protein
MSGKQTLEQHLSPGRLVVVWAGGVTMLAGVASGMTLVLLPVGVVLIAGGMVAVLCATAEATDQQRRLRHRFRRFSNRRLSRLQEEDVFSQTWARLFEDSGNHRFQWRRG